MDRVTLHARAACYATTALFVATFAAAGAPSSMPHPAPQVRAHPVDNAACVGCHAEIASEWRASLHRRSHDVPEFQRAYAREPQAFCRRCHAPEADAERDGAALGVACVTCHVTESDVLAAPAHGGSAPHALRRDARFATDAACASCHEFAFPRNAATPMQATVTEHAASAFADVTCAACHMPTVATSRGSHRSHAFAASRDPSSLREAVRASARRVSDSAIEIVVAPGRVGHAVPTGDLFRRLLVSAQAVDAEYVVVADASTPLGRKFAPQATTQVASVEIGDARVGRPARPREPVRVRLELGARAAGMRWVWSLRYQRVAFPRDDGTVVLDGEIVIDNGSLEATNATR